MPYTIFFPENKQATFVEKVFLSKGIFFQFRGIDKNGTRNQVQKDL